MLLNLLPTAAHVESPPQVFPQRVKFTPNTSPGLSGDLNTSPNGTENVMQKPFAVSLASATADERHPPSMTSSEVFRRAANLPAAFAEYWQ